MLWLPCIAAAVVGMPVPSCCCGIALLLLRRGSPLIVLHVMAVSIVLCILASFCSQVVAFSRSCAAAARTRVTELSCQCVLAFQHTLLPKTATRSSACLHRFRRNVLLIAAGWFPPISPAPVSRFWRSKDTGHGARLHHHSKTLC